MSQLLTVENAAQTVSEGEHLQIVAALNAQLQRDYNHSGWVKRGLAPAGSVIALGKGAKPPVGAWNLIIMDRSDQQGALGYHDDTQGIPIPYAEVFAIDSRDDGVTVSSVASHEALEMLVDPFVDPMPPRVVKRPGTSDRYIMEVCDAVQGGDYDIGGTMVSDFVLPAWYGLSSFRPTSFRGTVVEPWELAPQGYMSIEKPDGSWTQVFGSERARHPKWASRLPRIHEIVR